jgi:hypothetical protein
LNNETIYLEANKDENINTERQIGIFERIVLSQKSKSDLVMSPS